MDITFLWIKKHGITAFVLEYTESLIYYCSKFHQYFFYWRKRQMKIYSTYKKFIFISLLIVLSFGISLRAQETFDLVIKGGKVIDGCGNPWYRADIAIIGDRIVKIGYISPSNAGYVIDAADMIVSPGFIDIHTHCDRGLLDVPTADNYLRQGVTTVIGGNCGGSQWPIGTFLNSLKKQGISLNFATLVGHNTIREKVMGMADREPTTQELKRMKDMVALAMRSGAIGLSTGLKYLPGAYSKTEEVIELAKVAASYGGLYATHMRDEGKDIIESIKETIRIGREAKIRVQISHHKIINPQRKEMSRETLNLIQQARNEGIEITLDQYPYSATSTGISVLFPPWAMAGGKDKFVQRVRQPETKEKIKEEIVNNILYDRGGGDAKNIVISSCKFNPSLEGKSLAQILQEKGKEPTAENAADLAIELELQGDANALYHCLKDDDIRRIMASPLVMVASDGAICQPNVGMPHPRNYGTFPRSLGFYVRQEGVMSLENAVRKMTSLPAQTLRLNRRGKLIEGFYADITIFDYDKVKDMATWQSPHQYPVGIEWVIVNGKIVIQQEKHTGIFPGQILSGEKAGIYKRASGNN
jgi:N-acyl-D-amino-acid deacylase